MFVCCFLSIFLPLINMIILQKCQSSDRIIWPELTIELTSIADLEHSTLNKHIL